MTQRISIYPEKCRLCGAEREWTEEKIEKFTHHFDCNWRTDSSWMRSPKPPQTGHLALDVRWRNGSSSVNATISQDQYNRILAIIHEKEA